MDTTVEFPTSGPVILYGENESGKSTLQAFILFMLFGLPPKQRNFYKPITSGKMGGRLTILDPEVGRYTIERLDNLRNGSAVCYAEDGAEYDETWLKSRLKGMTDQTYRSIYSFSASDLAGLPKMKEEDLGEVLLGIGLTGTTAIYALESSLDSQISRLFKPSGKKPLINEQINKLDTRLGNLQKAKEQEATYREKKEAVQKYTENIEEASRTLQHEKAILHYNERKLQALPYLKKYWSVRKQLEQLPNELPFPENGGERMQQVKDKLLPVKSEYALLLDNRDKYEKKLYALETNDGDSNEETLQEAYKLKKEAEEYVAEKKEVSNISKQKEQLEFQMDEELNQLRINVDKVKLSEINLPFHTEKTWGELKAEQDTLDVEQSKHLEESHQLKKERTRLLSQAESLEEGLLTENRVEELKNKIYKIEENTVRRYSDTESKFGQNPLQSWKQKKKKANQKLFLLSFGLAILLILVGIIVENASYYLFAVITLTAGLLQWWHGKQSLTEIETFANTDGVSAGLVEKREAEHQLLLHERASSEIATLEAQLKSLDHTFALWQERGEQFQDRQNILTNKIDYERAQYPFLKGINVTYWLEIYHHLKHLIRLSREENRLADTLKQRTEKQDRFFERLNVFLNSSKWGKQDSTQEEKIVVLEKWILHYEENESEKLHYQHLYKETTEQLLSVKKKLTVYEETYNELLRYAQVQDENAYYERANLLSEKKQLQVTVARLEEQLQSFLRDENAVIPDEPEMVEQSNTVKQNIALLEKDMEDYRQQLADVKAELTQLEISGEYSEAFHTFSMEKEELHQSVRKWAVLKTAKGILEETKRKYRDKYLRRVIEKTSEYFYKLTGGDYQNVYPPVDGKLFQVESKDHVRYTVDQLSQGAKDQLYISLRIAISNIMSEKHRLPYILDDAFVHFDPTRTERMIQLVKELSNKQQIILFTCKEDFLQYFELENIIQIKNTVRIK